MQLHGTAVNPPRCLHPVTPRARAGQRRTSFLQRPPVLPLPAPRRLPHAVCLPLHAPRSSPCRPTRRRRILDILERIIRLIVSISSREVLHGKLHPLVVLPMTNLFRFVSFLFPAHRTFHSSLFTRHCALWRHLHRVSDELLFHLNSVVPSGIRSRHKSRRRSAQTSGRPR